MSDEELREFIDAVDENEAAIAELVAKEVDIAQAAHEQLDDDLQAELAVRDLLPKVDDALDRFKDWWDDR